MDIEIWKDIPEYEGLYQVSNLGNIYSLISSKKIKSVDRGNGYFMVGLSKNKKKTCLQVHRIVLTAFCPNVFDKPEVNHIDGNPSNNKLSNLEWCNRKENVWHSIHVLKTPRKKNLPHFKKQISQFSKNGDFIQHWDSARQVQKLIGIKSTSITRCCKGRSRSAGKFIWKYSE